MDLLYAFKDEKTSQADLNSLQAGFHGHGQS
jgi:hypothetical protein